MFSEYIAFLQENGLTTRTILDSGAEASTETKIMASDLTAEGLDFVRRAEQRWFAAVDRGVPPEDTTILLSELQRLRRQG